MLKSLTLQNFKRHESLHLDFTGGLNVIRADNEEGKSTIYHAIAYALWGSRALPLSLDETVTWGKPTSTLRVTLVFSIAGIEYTITRSKGGAELVGYGVTASGQSEVTAFVERITGANAAIGAATMLAAQSGLQSMLGNETVALIEKLSSMDLIDSLISAVQLNLPSGSTKSIEQTLASMQTLEAPIADFSEAVAEKQHASISVENAKVELGTAQSKLAEAVSAADGAESRVRLQRVREANRKQLQVQLVAAVPQWPAEPLVGSTSEELEKLALEELALSRTRKAYRTFLSCETTPVLQCTIADLCKTQKEASVKLGQLHERQLSLTSEKATVKASGIYDKSCGLCGKLLQDVPEVVAVNSRVLLKLSELTDEQAAVKLETDSTAETSKSLRALHDLDYAIEVKLNSIADYVTVDTSTVPRTAKWVGATPDMSDGPRVDYSALRAKRIAEEKLYDNNVAKAQQVEQQIVELRSQLAVLEGDVAKPGDEDAINRMSSEAVNVTVMQQNLSKQQNLYALADAALKHAMSLHQSELATYQAKLEAKLQLEAQLTETVFNNNLIKKLREARPVVARELWNLVLHGVSHIFSQIRGTPSAVTRSDTKFLVDGKPVEAYSGSTKDSLGLAIRIMLQKTFLPNVSVMLLDEPASGCSETRESDMLAAVVSADFAQVLLVTHSDLADTFANRLIEL